jgi:hypothetical protein
MDDTTNELRVKWSWCFHVLSLANDGPIDADRLSVAPVCPKTPESHPNADAKSVGKRCRREEIMTVQWRDFLLVVTLAVATLASASAEMAPTVGPSQGGKQGTVSIPDFSGVWTLSPV